MNRFSKARSVRRWWMVALSFFILIVACSSSQKTPYPTPPYDNWGDPPAARESLMPSALDCSRITTAKPGPMWNELTIGVSAYADVRKRLSPAATLWDVYEGDFILRNAEQSLNQWFQVKACFLPDDLRLSALNVYGASGYPAFLSDWVAKYGKPDVVTWSDSYFYRSLIWANEGLLVVIGVDNELTGNVILFSPMSVDELQTSWTLESLPTEGQEVGSGADYVLEPEQEVEDPWDLTP